MKSLYYGSTFYPKLKKYTLKGGREVIKSATHGKNVRKDVIKKHSKTTSYITVAFNAIVVAIGYTMSLNTI